MFRFYDPIFFRALVLCTVGVSAYLHAEGVSDLVASTLPEARTQDDWEPIVAAEVPAVEKSGKPILDRNPFDSVTGPLSLKKADQVAAEEELTLDLSDPLRAERCPSIRVYATSESEDPRWSLAVAQEKDAPHSTSIRVGDTLGEMTVAYIGYNRLELSPAVWFVSDAQLCQSLVFSDRPRFQSAFDSRHRAPKAKPHKKKKRKAKKRSRKRRRSPPRLPTNLAKQVTKVSSDEFRIDRSAVDTLISEAPDLLKRTRVIPVKENGRVSAMKLSNLGKNTLLTKLGFKEGDQLEMVNGVSVTSPEKALKAYATIRSLSDISVKLRRGGKPMTLDFRIR